MSSFEKGRSNCRQNSLSMWHDCLPCSSVTLWAVMQVDWFADASAGCDIERWRVSSCLRKACSFSDNSVSCLSAALSSSASCFSSRSLIRARVMWRSASSFDWKFSLSPRKSCICSVSSYQTNTHNSLYKSTLRTVSNRDWLYNVIISLCVHKPRNQGNGNFWRSFM